jgi:hypothetical protein
VAYETSFYQVLTILFKASWCEPAPICEFQHGIEDARIYHHQDEAITMIIIHMRIVQCQTEFEFMTVRSSFSEGFFSDTLQIAARRCHSRKGRFSVAVDLLLLVFSAFSELFFCFGIRSKEHGRRLLAQIQQSLLG